jgi:anti-anti-sigma factor
MAPLEETLSSLTTTPSPWLIVDLRLVTYISSRGLKALVSAWRRARDTSGDVVLCSINPQVMGIFETVGFNQIFDIYPDQENAVKAVSLHQQANK